MSPPKYYGIGEDGEMFEVSPNYPMAIGPDGRPVKAGTGVRPDAKATLAQLAKGEAIHRGQDALVSAATGNSQETITGVSPSVGAAATPESQAAWNAAADKATAAAMPSGWQLSGIGGAGNYILPSAGLAGAYDLWANHPQDVGHGSGYLEGAASGAAIGSYFGPVGAAVGGGLGLLANAFGFGHESATKKEEQNRELLSQQGINVPNASVKEWELNPEFAATRDESKLKGKDIIHAAQNYMIPGYAGLDAARQEAIGNKELELGAIREEHGQVDVAHSAALDDFINSQMNAVSEGGGGKKSSGPSKQEAAVNNEIKKQQKTQKISKILDTPIAPPPRYDINLSQVYRNPYL